MTTSRPSKPRKRIGLWRTTSSASASRISSRSLVSAARRKGCGSAIDPNVPDGILAGMPSDHLWARFSSSLGARGLRWAGKLNVPVYRLSGGRLMGKVGKAPVLLLTTTGRKSGQKRTTPVVYLTDGDKVVLIDTN